MKRIEIIYTGGTIGGKTDSQKIITEDLKPKVLIDMVCEQLSNFNLGKEIEISISTPVKIFSENIYPKTWSMIAEATHNAINKNVDGIIILHGTDTITYTSAALSFMLQGIKIPLILTGANKPLLSEDSDAPRNITDAIIVARQKEMKGVFLVYSGYKDRNSTIHLGCKVRKFSYLGFCFQTVNSKPIGEVKTYFYSRRPKIVIENKELLQTVVGSNKSKQYVFNNRLENTVAFFQVFPGFNPENIDDEIKKRDKKAIILELYNSGTGCVEGPYSLIPSLQLAEKKGIPVFITSQHEGTVKMDLYQSSIALRDVGAIPLGNMIKEAAIPKLMWILAQTKNKDEIIKLMLTNYAGELS